MFSPLVIVSSVFLKLAEQVNTYDMFSMGSRCCSVCGSRNTLPNICSTSTREVLFASDASHVAMCVNALSALASAFTILFLFWTITALARKLVVSHQPSAVRNQLSEIRNMSDDQKSAIIKKAGEMFFRLGIRSVSIDDICRELGISKRLSTFILPLKKNWWHNYCIAM